ncbi:MAG TPA: SGNH/GDSL hydrolase family protein [Ktedonosporobacter sp.]|nr:SGNH/GDSL hydrolase family protein [Ktedonosporobacter sp.]
MATQITPRRLLEYFIQLIHPEKTLTLFPGISDALIATMLGTDEATYHAIRESFQANIHQAAQELLADPEFAEMVDRIPFAAGSKVVGFGSSSTDDLQSWFEILYAVFELRRPQDGIRFVNAGVSGDTTTHEMARFLSVVNEQPDWIICYISSNDGRRHGISPTKPLVSPEETEKNLVMLRHFAASQTKAKWIWMTPTSLIEERIAAFPPFALGQTMFYNEDSARIAEIVLKQPDPVVNLWELFGHPTDPELVSWDGLHPSLKGYTRILQALVSDLVKSFS